MTALRKYLRLESPGLWRETPSAQLREVVVGLREATIVLSDPKTEMALAQWSLPALTRLNPGKLPALYSPGEDDAETLEVDDTEMMAALDTVRTALERRRPKPGRLRGVLLGGFGAVIGSLAVFWLPGQLIDYTAAMLPPATRSDLGKLALQDLTKVTGSPCTGKAGTAASVALGLRINPTHPPHVLVVRDALQAPLALPGDLLILPEKLLQSTETPDALAGYILNATGQAALSDPMRPLLEKAGLLATIRLLASGAIAPEALDGYGESLLIPPTPTLSDEAQLAAFQAAKITAQPYAYAVDKSGETTLPLIEADPFPKGSQPEVLSAAHWKALQDICNG
ncbi:MAG: hypothetical protein U1A24_12920 [Cypionkella sp.]|uniref:hypothetical protein n=1 Tax=Cypionkella sp. TaxID=2811411 RepID=UPI002ABC3069|nr:hypothetical protein [Cypionkella sp.]MDZ4311442.1 hypothetical protein [Cypionkella sp.]MDZ4394289.1 hypothetical protein [Cypionkella sp.]